MHSLIIGGWHVPVSLCLYIHRTCCLTDHGSKCTGVRTCILVPLFWILYCHVWIMYMVSLALYIYMLEWWSWPHPVVKFALANWWSNSLTNVTLKDVFVVLCIPSVVDCFDPGVPANGLKQLPSTTFGSTVRYSCRQGHLLQGQSLRSCQPSGRWSGTLPQCVPSDCGDLGAPQDGRVDFSSTTIGSFASYSCSVGYTLVGTATRICQPNGEWSASAPDCACEWNLMQP